MLIYKIISKSSLLGIAIMTTACLAYSSATFAESDFYFPRDLCTCDNWSEISTKEYRDRTSIGRRHPFEKRDITKGERACHKQQESWDINVIWTEKDGGTCWVCDAKDFHCLNAGTKSVEGLWRGTVHRHEFRHDPICKVYLVDLTFKTNKQGITTATWSGGYSLKGKLVGHKFSFDIFHGNKHHGRGYFDFTNNYDGFVGKWQDNSGHGGSWEGKK